MNDHSISLKSNPSFGFTLGHTYLQNWRKIACHTFSRLMCGHWTLRSGLTTTRFSPPTRSWLASFLTLTSDTCQLHLALQVTHCIVTAFLLFFLIFFLLVYKANFKARSKQNHFNFATSELKTHHRKAKELELFLTSQPPTGSP